MRTEFFARLVAVELMGGKKKNHNDVTLSLVRNDSKLTLLTDTNIKPILLYDESLENSSNIYKVFVKDGKEEVKITVCIRKPALTLYILGSQYLHGLSRLLKEPRTLYANGGDGQLVSSTGSKMTQDPAPYVNPTETLTSSTHKRPRLKHSGEDAIMNKESERKRIQKAAYHPSNYIKRKRPADQSDSNNEIENAPDLQRRRNYTDTSPSASHNNTIHSLRRKVRSTQGTPTPTIADYGNNSRNALSILNEAKAVSNSVNNTPTRLPKNTFTSNSLQKPLFQRSVTFKDKSGTRFEGLRNLGNTCYLNAIIQSLLNISAFSHDLMDPTFINSDIPEGSLYRSFVNVFRKRLQHPHSVLSPTQIVDCISKLSTQLKNGNQEDAQEFLCECLEFLHKDLGSVVHPLVLTEPENCSPSKMEDATHGSALNPIDINFQSEIKRVIKCDECGYVSTAKENFRDWSLDLPDVHKNSLETLSYFKLESILQNYFQKTEVEYNCGTSGCKSSTATIHNEITNLPRILVLHLKRFIMDLDTNKVEKREDDITIPTTVDLTEWCSDKVQLPKILNVSPSVKSENNPIASNLPSTIKNGNDLQQVKYRLKTVVSHKGSGYKSGHYVCDVYNEKERKWFCYDDSMVTSLGNIHELNNARKSSGYLFFFVADII